MLHTDMRRARANKLVFNSWLSQSEGTVHNTMISLRLHADVRRVRAGEPLFSYVVLVVMIPRHSKNVSFPCRSTQLHSDQYKLSCGHLTF